MGTFNKSARGLDRKQTGDLAECKLLDISDFFAVGSVPPSWESEKSVTLYTNPQQIQRSLTATYGSVNGLLTSQSSRTYGHSDRTPVKLSGILVDTQDKKMDATPFMDLLEGMTRASLNSYPPVMALVWGLRVIQPVVITDLSIVETAWVNGLLSQASVELTLEYVKSPSYQSSADERRVKNLTDRERARVKAQAEKELKEEAEKKSKEPIGKSDMAPVKVAPNGTVTQGTKVIKVAARPDPLT